MFVHLKCHSQYSFLRAVGSPEELVARAAAEKMPAVALTDTNGMYAAVPFYAKAREAGVKPIVGVVVERAAVLPPEQRRQPYTVSHWQPEEPRVHEQPRARVAGGKH